MSRILIILMGICFIGCQFQENRNKIIEQHRKDSIEQKRKVDSLNRKQVDDSILFTKFKKWESTLTDVTTYVNKYFEHDIIQYDFTFDLEIRANILTVEINKYKYPNFSKISIARTNCWNTNENMDIFYQNTYFKLYITDSSNNTTSHVFLEKNRIIIDDNTDDQLLPTIIKNEKYKIKVEEFCARLERGHFEGDKLPEDKLVRSFYLSDKNKVAIKESYLLFLLLDKK
jgi:hypothetical protein